MRPVARSDDCCPAGCTHDDDPDCSPVRRRRRQTTLGRDMRHRRRPAPPTAARPRATTTTPARTTTWSARGYVLRAVRVHARSPSSAPATAAALRGRTPTPIWIPTALPCAATAIVDRPAELCDFGAGGLPGPDTCPSPDVCMPLRRDRPGRYVAAPPASRRRSPPALAATAAVRRGAPRVDDSDCPSICGDGVVETGENCDRAITGGSAGRLRAHLRRRRRLHGRPGVGVGRGRARARAPTRPSPAAFRTTGAARRAARPRATRLRPDVRRQADRRGESSAIRPARARRRCPDDGDPCTEERLTGPATLQRRVPARPDHRLLGTDARRLLPDGLHARQRHRLLNRGPGRIAGARA